MSEINKELIENFRKIVLPFVSNRLYKTNFEGQGETDKAEFEQDFNEILNLAISALNPSGYEVGKVETRIEYGTDGQPYKLSISNGKELERPQGEWYYGEDECGQDGWFCSECDFFVPWYYEYYEKDIDFIREYKACPHCIAEMVTYTGKDRDTEYKVTETPSEIRVEPTPIERLKTPFERVKENLNKAFGIKHPGKVMAEFWQKGKTE